MKESEFLFLLKKKFLSYRKKLTIDIGDDCAIAPFEGEGVFASDQVIEGVHFNHSMSANLVGRKLVARNLSDLASMGQVIPKYALVNIASNKSSEYLLEFVDGICSLAKKYKLAIIGGDFAIVDKDSQSVFSLTIVGQLQGKGITRSGAEMGDYLFVSGQLGNSFISEHHLKFEPEMALGAYLSKNSLVKAMIDLSDGLAKDCLNLLEFNEFLAIKFNTHCFPLRGGATIKQALEQGEDYGLCFVVNKKNKEFLENQNKFPVTCIGEFIARKNFLFCDENEKVLEIKGFEYII